jgi:hypothetical protein
MLSDWLPDWNKEEDILERCTTAIQQGSSVEDCLALYPGRRDELEPLLGLAARLNSARALHAPEQLRTAVQARLADLSRLGASGLQERQPARPQPPQDSFSMHSILSGLGRRRKDRRSPLETGRLQRRPRLAPLFAGLLLILLVVSGIGTASASARALPGDFLYPVKRAQEDFRLSITLDETSQARLRLDYAGRRIDEAATSLQENRPSAIDQALVDYNDQIQAELRYLDQDSGLSSAQQAELANLLVSRLSDHEAWLKTIVTDAPAAARPKVETALAITLNAQQKALQIILKQKGGGKNGLSPTSAPGSPSARPHPTKALPSRPVPPAPTTTPMPSAPVQPGVTKTPTPQPGTTRTPILTRSPAAAGPTVQATPAPGNVITPTPKPTWPKPTGNVISTPRATRTPVWQSPTIQPSKTNAASPGNRATPTRPPPSTNP